MTSLSQTSHAHGHHDSLADLLDLDARVMHGYWSDAMAWVHTAVGGRPVHSILDVGAGTGVGTTALAERFADAQVVAADSSEEMLGRVRSRATAGSLTGRVSTVKLDLDGSWSEIGVYDVIWASAVLHELAHPDAAFGNMLQALRPGGLLAVVEIDGPPRFLEDQVGDGLEARIHAVLGRVRAGDNDHPDWSSSLERAGFARVERMTFTVDTAIDSAGAGGRYAQTYLRRIQPFVAAGLSESDRAALDALVADEGASSVRHRDDLRLRAGRTGWAARRP